MPLSVVSEAPGRICLFGDHQDYLLNPVIACAIDRQITLTLVENESNSFCISKPDIDPAGSLEIIPLRKGVAPKREQNVNASNSDLNFISLALDVLSRYECIPTCGFDVCITGNIPINAGLSSSSALTIAWINFLVTVFGGNFNDSGTGTVIKIQPCFDFSNNGCRTPLPRALLARLAWETEVLELQTSGGKMDHYSISVGGCIHLETENDHYTELDLLGNMRMVIGVSGQGKDTNGTLSHLKTKQLEAVAQLMKAFPEFTFKNNDVYTAGCYNYREAEANCHKYVNAVEEELQPYLHAALFNNYLTRSAYELLATRDADTIRHVGQRMSAHNNELRYQLKNTTERIDKMVDNAVNVGAWGAKIVGSGGGGCVVALASQEVSTKVATAMKTAGAVDVFVAQGINISSGPKITMSRIAAASDSPGSKAKSEVTSNAYFKDNDKMEDKFEVRKRPLEEPVVKKEDMQPLLKAKKEDATAA